MPQGDGAAIHVDSVSVELQRLLNSQVLRCESFIYFDQIDVGELQSGLFESDSSSRYGTDAHDLRLHSSDTPANDATKRLRFCAIRCCDDDGRSAINNAACVACRDKSILRKSCLQF